METENKKSIQDFEEMNTILFHFGGLEYKVNPKDGIITIFINNGTSHQLILKNDGTWQLN